MRWFPIVLALAIPPAPALAWGEFAHRLTARIAQTELTPRTRREIAFILAGSQRLATPQCPMKTLEQAAIWPDCVRSLPARFAFAAPWHYQNISVCGPFDIAANCPDGNCITAQIPRQLAIAADRSAAAAARAQALAFVVHFVGDLHQPLHVGEKADRGGNSVRARYGVKGGSSMNLHRIWDVELAERNLTEPPAITPRSGSAAQRRDWRMGDPAAWAKDSWELSRTLVYPLLQGVPDGCSAPAGTVPAGGVAVVDDAYVAAARAAVRNQVQAGGIRLAVLLNGALAR